jgi:hypothetical protein
MCRPQQASKLHLDDRFLSEAGTDTHARTHERTVLSWVLLLLAAEKFAGGPQQQAATGVAGSGSRDVGPRGMDHLDHHFPPLLSPPIHSAGETGKWVSKERKMSKQPGMVVCLGVCR